MTRSTDRDDRAPLPAELRSHRRFGPDDLRSFGHRSRAKQSGFDAEELRGKPVVAILNTWSETAGGCGGLGRSVPGTAHGYAHRGLAGCGAGCCRPGNLKGRLPA